MERDCAESQSQQCRWLALTPNLLRLVLRTQPRSWPTAKFTDSLRMHWSRPSTNLLHCTPRLYLRQVRPYF